jgi:hypothetical protein
MQRFWLCLSFDANVDNTLSSIREASRYFGTERMTLIAHRVPFFLSNASTTLPKVPCPSSLRIVSRMIVKLANYTRSNVRARTALCKICVRDNDIVAILIVDLLILHVRFLELISIRVVTDIQ